MTESRRLTQHPFSAEHRKPTIPFAPEKVKVDAIAPTTTTSFTITSPGGMKESSKCQAAHQGIPQDNYISSLQDENADLQKQIHRLEMALRDNGFDRNGKHAISIVEGNVCDLIIDGKNLEMMSMMGMDPDRPTVITRYMEFKVLELQDELEAVELDRDRLLSVIRTMEANALLESNHKQRIDESMNNANTFFSGKRGVDEDGTTNEEETGYSITDEEHKTEEKKDAVPNAETMAQNLETHNKKLEEWLAKIVEESAKREQDLKETVNELEADVETSRNREIRLQNEIAKLKEAEEQGSSLNDYSKQNEELEEVKSRNQKIEDCLLKVVEESKKREEVLKQRVDSLKADAEDSSSRERLLKKKIEAFQATIEGLEDDITRSQEMEKVLEGALEKEINEHDRLIQQILELQNKAKRTKQINDADQQKLKSCVLELEAKLEAAQGKKRLEVPTADEYEDALYNEVPVGQQPAAEIVEEKERQTAHILELENDCKAEVAEEQYDAANEQFSFRYNQLENELESSNVERECLSKKLVGLQNELQEEKTERRRMSNLIDEQEEELEAIRKKHVNDLEVAAENSESNHERLVFRTKELETELEVERNERRRLNTLVDELEKEIETITEKYKNNLEVAAENSDSNHERVAFRLKELGIEQVEHERIRRIIDQMQNENEINVGKNDELILTHVTRTKELEEKLEALNITILELNTELEGLFEQIAKQEEKRVGTSIVAKNDSNKKFDDGKAEMEIRIHELERKLELTSNELKRTKEENARLLCDVKSMDAKNMEKLNASRLSELGEDLRFALHGNDSYSEGYKSYLHGDTQPNLGHQFRNKIPQPLTTSQHSQSITIDTNDTVDDEDMMTLGYENSIRDIVQIPLSEGGDDPGEMYMRARAMSRSPTLDRTSNDPIGGTLEYPTFSSRKSPCRKSPRKGDEDLGTIFRRASRTRILDEGSSTKLSLGKEELMSKKKFESKDQFTKDCLRPLIDKAEAEFGKEIPANIIQGIYDALSLQVKEGSYGVGWEDFEEILEDACQGHDEDAWFDIQEAFFTVWEEENYCTMLEESTLQCNTRSMVSPKKVQNIANSMQPEAS